MSKKLNSSERIIDKMLELVEALIDGLKARPIRTILKLVVLSWFNTLAIGFLVMMGLLIGYALFTNTASYRFGRAKNFLIRKYPSTWQDHLDELQPFDYDLGSEPSKEVVQ